MTLSYHTSFSLSIQTFITDPKTKHHKAVVGIKERNEKKALELAAEKSFLVFSLELSQAEINRYVAKREKMIYIYCMCMYEVTMCMYIQSFPSTPTELYETNPRA